MATPRGDRTSTPYSILVPRETCARASTYLEELRAGRVEAGRKLAARLDPATRAAAKPRDLLGLLFDTKEPRIFAESAVRGDGSDWTNTELGLLGDVSVAVPVEVFDDGKHTKPTPHDPSFGATLVFTPGALLRSGFPTTPADWDEVTTADDGLSDGYDRLYERRLLPVLRHLDARATAPRSVVVTVPGLGCGQFAGEFEGQLGARLAGALEKLLVKHGAGLPNLAAVRFDPYDECEDATSTIHGIAFRVRPLKRTRHARCAQLCRPEAYAEDGDDFSGCTLASVVAWDHVSWPGNDFFGGARSTDDGVKAAATDSMRAITGREGRYDPERFQYRPPDGFATWGEVVRAGIAAGALRLWRDDAVRCSDA